MIAHRINGEHAFCVGGWTESLAQDLLKHNVTRMELEDGDWSDLACFDGQVDSVQNLKISGTIKAIDNIHIFKKYFFGIYTLRIFCIPISINTSFNS